MWQIHIFKCVPGLQIPPGWAFLAKGTNLINSVIPTGQELSATLPLLFFIIVQSLSHVRLFVTPWTVAYQAPLSFTISWSLLKLHVHWVSDAIQPIILCHSLLLLPSIFPSIRVFSNKLALCIRWLEYWSFSFSISPSNEYSGLISFRIDCFDLLAVQGSLLQHHCSKASILQHTFFMDQLSHLHMTSGKTIEIFVGKVMSLLFNMLSRFVHRRWWLQPWN